MTIELEPWQLPGQDAPPELARGPGFATELARHGDRVALIAPDGSAVSYLQLDERSGALARVLGAERRLVVTSVTSSVESIVAYLAALRGGHPMIVVNGSSTEHLEVIVSTYDPDVVLHTGGGRLDLEERRTGTAHDLHPELALLLSTSGSTSSPKLVRLSQANLQSNAEAIASYLAITDQDRAPTVLPMQYCYGLSVINSHLLRGAGLILTAASVVDPCFWSAFRAHGATSLAGVPHTFELLDRVGFADMDLPTLRYVTQAGGRLAPERVRHLAELGRRRGWDLFVMYGQTEATARMAYLPPERATRSPAAIGVAIPGGSLRIDAPDTAGHGELVYRGPNVMLGYAERAGDLALGRTLDELRTGDIARVDGDGLIEIVGRASRFIKPFGVRIDLDRAEAVLAEHGHHALCTGDDDRLVVAVDADAGGDRAAATDIVRRCFGLPAGAVQVLQVEVLPRLASGKPDYATIRRLAEVPADGRSSIGHVGDEGQRAAVDAAFAAVAGSIPLTDDATFVSLGGDSLSYVETSVRLEEALGYLPADWHLLTLGELRRLAPQHRLTTTVETSVVLRALAIALVVGSHVGSFALTGGAHVLLAVAGWNFARFRLTGTEHRDRVRPALRAIGRVAVPSVAYIAALLVLADGMTITNVALINNYLGDGTWRFWYWFIEVLVHILVVATIVFAVPAVRRLEAAQPFRFAFGVLLASLALPLVHVGDPANDIYRTHAVLWLFVVGWAAQRAATVAQRASVTAVALLVVPSFFDTLSRQLLVAAGLALLVWVPQLPLLRPTNRLVGLLAGASLYIYLIHWQLFPVLLRHLPPAAVTVASLAVGTGVWWVVQRVPSALSRIGGSTPIRGAARFVADGSRQSEYHAGMRSVS